MNNLYFILDLPEQAMEQILEHCVGDAESQRCSLDDKKCVVKLKQGEPIPQILNSYTPYTHSEILPIMWSSEWTDPNLP